MLIKHTHNRLSKIREFFIIATILKMQIIRWNVKKDIFLRNIVELDPFQSNGSAVGHDPCSSTFYNLRFVILPKFLFCIIYFLL